MPIRIDDSSEANIMDKKHRIIIMICGTCGIIGGILMIIAAFMEAASPRPLWIAASVCMLLNVIGIIMNYRYIRRNGKTDTPPLEL